jgi:hypothetical protein
LLLFLCMSCPAPALTIRFNYDYDTLGFFNPGSPNGAQARATLENAGRNYEMFTDSLLAIVPGGGNKWSAVFDNPATGSSVSLPGLVVPADTMIVFVGARNLGSNILGEGGPGGYSVSGTQGWLDTVAARGQGGALLDPQRDFGPWGGAVTFGSNVTWNYNLASGPGNTGQNDFFSTCLHELAHVLGFGTCESWYRLVNSSDNTFAGPSSESLYGGPVPLYGDSAHWTSGTQGLSGGQVQEAAMDPALTTGTRKRLTGLDVAGLADLGWQIPARGDANLDGIVDAADYVNLKRDFAGPPTATWTGGDFDFDGAVTWRDLAALEGNFGNLSPTQPAQLPEPAAPALLAAGCLAILRRRKTPEVNRQE